MIESIGYSINTESKNMIWRTAKNFYATVTKVGSGTHAEITVFNNLGISGKKEPFLIVQNAFPCEKCDEKFINASKITALVIKITADEGSYSLEHGYKANTNPLPPLPIYIWYLRGNKSITLNATPPIKFPVCPSVDI